MSWFEKWSQCSNDKDVKDGTEQSQGVAASRGGVGGFGSADEAAAVWG
jgi:hypothetical protein